MTKIQEEINLWLGLTDKGPPTSGKVVSDHDKRVMDQIFIVLNVLDSKASTLMRFNGLLSATMVLLLNPIVAGNVAYKPLFALSFLAAILAEVICFFIFSVKYRFFKHESNTATELTDLANVAEERHVLFKWAWSLTLAATLMLATGVLLNVH